jgi:hypothetical protein
MSAVRDLVSKAREGKIWRPANGRLFAAQFIRARAGRASRHADAEHLQAAVDWLLRAQDASSDGGVSGRYHLGRGWTSSYPETTGYIIPTFLALAERRGDNDLVRRARAAVTFLLSVQLPEGGFPGLEIADNRSEPSPFNTAQILHGLTVWHKRSGDEEVLRALERAGEWLVSIQDADGAWRRYFYETTASTYSAHLSCWLVDLGNHLGREDFLAAGRRHMEWVFRHHDGRTGWFDLCGFTPEDHAARRAFTHTIAYTLWGVLHACEGLGIAEGRTAVETASRGIIACLDREKWIPGILDAEWRGQASFACLTGNAQLALIWFRLFEANGQQVYRDAALRAIELVKLAQPLTNPEPGIRGGIPGSEPIWGDYIQVALPNWAAKYFIDAMLKKEALRAQLV